MHSKKGGGSRRRKSRRGAGLLVPSSSYLSDCRRRRTHYYSLKVAEEPSSLPLAPCLIIWAEPSEAAAERRKKSPGKGGG